MKLLTKFTLIFLVVFGAGLALCGVVAYRFLRQDATDQAVQQARLMMQTMLAARTYTTKPVEPLLAGTQEHERAFLPQTVPAYAATESFNYLSTSPVRDQTAINYLGQSFPNPFYGLASVYGTTITRANLLRPYPEFSSVQETDPAGFSFYNALQATAQKRFSHGYTLNLAYTWSKGMDAMTFLNSVDPRPWYGIRSFDRAQRIVVSGVWELPRSGVPAHVRGAA